MLLRKLALAFLLIIYPMTSWATPPATALFGNIQGTPVALYAMDSGIGPCFFFEEQQANGNWYAPFSPIGCGFSQSSVDAAGGPVPFVASWLPYINPSIAGQFSGGTSVSSQVNMALTTAFKFSGAANPAVVSK